MGGIQMETERTKAFKTMDNIQDAIRYCQNRQEIISNLRPILEQLEADLALEEMTNEIRSAISQDTSKNGEISMEEL